MNNNFKIKYIKCNTSKNGIALFTFMIVMIFGCVNLYHGYIDLNGFTVPLASELKTVTGRINIIRYGNYNILILSDAAGKSKYSMRSYNDSEYEGKTANAKVARGTIFQIEINNKVIKNYADVTGPANNKIKRGIMSIIVGIVLYVLYFAITLLIKRR